MRTLDPSYQTLYSELAQRALDATFKSEFSPDGRFITMEIRGRRYWYFDIAQEGKKKRTYVGPVDDPEITRRVEDFKDLKADSKARRKLVSTLLREAHLPRPDPKAAEIVQAVSDAGFFRLRGVLVGTVAFHCYAAVLGVTSIPSATLQTADADFAQFHAISAAVGDAMPPLLPRLREIDPTFREVPDANDGRQITKYTSRSGYKVEFLTPNTGSSEHDGHPAPMPALGGPSAQPLRFLDFLIHQPIRAVLLYKAGVPVLIPAPERYAVHKLIVATRRLKDNDGTAKSRKDRQQASTLIQIMADQRQSDALADAYIEAWDRGPAWREALSASLRQLSREVIAALETGVAVAAEELGKSAKDYGLSI